MINTFVKAKIVYKGGSLDISDRIENFKYIHSVEKDSYLEIKIKKEYVPSMIDDSVIINGNMIVFQWGYLGGQTSRVHTVKIQDPTIVYAERVSMTIKGLDIGNTMKKTSSLATPTKSQTTNFENEILKPICTKHGLVLKTEGSNLSQILPSSIGPMAGVDDFNYLKNIAKANDFICYVDGNSLVFKKRNLGKKSSRIFTYGDGSGTVISFAPKTNETTGDNLTGETKATSVNPLTGEVEETKSQSKEIVLGQYDANGKDVDSKNSSTLNAFAQKGFDYKNKSIPSSLENQTAVNKTSADKKIKEITADLLTIGDPTMEGDLIITMAGVSVKDSGNWYVTEIAHTITASGETYLCNFSLNKNGTGRPVKTNAEKTKSEVNKTTGSKENKSTKTIPEYNSNGKEIKQ
jgi:phage protein D